MHLVVYFVLTMGSHQLCPVQIRYRRLHYCREYFQRPSRPIDLHGPHRSVQDTWCCACGLRDLQGSLGRRHRHLQASRTCPNCMFRVATSFMFHAFVQYFHRNTCSEILGLVLGEYGGRSSDFQAGGLSYETGFCPHGGEYRKSKHCWKTRLSIFVRSGCKDIQSSLRWGSRAQAYS